MNKIDTKAKAAKEKIAVTLNDLREEIAELDDDIKLTGASLIYGGRPLSVIPTDELYAIWQKEWITYESYNACLEEFNFAPSRDAVFFEALTTYIRKRNLETKVKHHEDLLVRVDNTRSEESKAVEFLDGILGE